MRKINKHLTPSILKGGIKRIEMEKSTYDQAKNIQERIDHLDIKSTQVRKMVERNDDAEFNSLRKLAYNALRELEDKAQEEFRLLKV